jgi:hypothetical protein
LRLFGDIKQTKADGHTATRSITMQNLPGNQEESTLKTFHAPRLLRTKSMLYENLTGKVRIDNWKVGGVDLY